MAQDARWEFIGKTVNSARGARQWSQLLLFNIRNFQALVQYKEFPMHNVYIRRNVFHC